jgi:hypothetical protein
MDFTYIEAFLRNLLYRFGQETGLPITGRDWELGVAAVVILVLLLLWTWPTRRAFRIGSSLRWLVAVLNLGSLAFWPIWFFALILSGIKRSSPTFDTKAKPVQPRSAPAQANPVPAMLADALKMLVRTAQQRAGGGTKPTVGPWGKQARPAAASPSQAQPAAAPPKNARSSSAPRTPTPIIRPTASVATPQRGSRLPNRETWIRRRG